MASEQARQSRWLLHKVVIEALMYETAGLSGFKSLRRFYNATLRSFHGGAKAPLFQLANQAFNRPALGGVSLSAARIDLLARHTSKTARPANRRAAMTT